MKIRSLRLSVLMVVFAAASSFSLELVAHDEILTANFTERAGPNRYVVQFPAELGGQLIEMPITGGQFKLVVNEEEGTSRILAWRQDIEAISIYDANTGPITVTVDETQASAGTFDPVSGAFAVTASFILAFDDSQLRGFGFTSPFVLTATERGTIYGVGQIGTIGMYLSGKGKFGLGEFSYTCQTTAEFDYTLPPSQGQPGDANHDHQFDVADPVAMLGDLFLGAPAACPGAMNSNGDSTTDLADAVYMLNYLYLGGTAPSRHPVECAVDG